MKYIQIALIVAIIGEVLVACSNSDKYFKDERYKKMIYAISYNNDDVFDAEYEMTAEGEVVGTQPFAVSGTNPIDEDVHLTVEKASDILAVYNDLKFQDEKEKYAHELKAGEYSFPSINVDIRAGENPSYEVGKLQIRIKMTTLEKLSVDSVYFIPLRIAEASPYEIFEDKRSVLHRIYKKNKYASLKTTTSYTSIGYADGKPITAGSKIVWPLTYNSIRAYIAGEVVYNNKDDEKTIGENAMIITVNETNEVKVTAYNPQSTLRVETVSPSSDPDEISYNYRNNYDPSTKTFYLHYRYRKNGGKWIYICESLQLEKVTS